MISDSFGRAHNYLRISLTDRCNLRCAYCMPDEDYDFMRLRHLMQYDEIIKIAETFVSLGVNKIRLTGGEPLSRKDFDQILTRLAKMPVEVSLTTNGSLLHKHWDVIQATGLKNINISLDTLSPALFQKLTRRDRFHQTITNITHAIDLGLNIKINCVVMKDTNESEIENFLYWTLHSPIEVRFIEFMPFTANEWSAGKMFSRKDILAAVSKKFEFHPIRSDKNSTSESFRVRGHKGKFAIISSMTQPFCTGCNRMRLTADGKMKNCLFSDNETDLLTALRNGNDIEALIRACIWAKKQKFGGQFDPAELNSVNTVNILNRSMIGIGG